MQRKNMTKIENINLPRQDIVKKILELVEKRLPAEQVKLITQFIDYYYSNISEEDLNYRNIEDLYGAMISHWNLLYQRKPEECKVRLYNPHYEQSGWQSKHTIIEVVHDDMPFLVDSLRMEILRAGFNVHFMIHFGGFNVQRDEENRVVKILNIHEANTEKNQTSEAAIYIEIDKQSDPEILQTLQDNLYRILTDVRKAVKDWKRMRERMEEALAELDKNPPPFASIDVSESKDFLRWLLDNHFTFLGCRDYEIDENKEDIGLRLISGSGLGVLRDESKSLGLRKMSTLPAAARELALAPQVLVISKTNTKATIHRPVYTDYIGVKRFNNKGEPIGERRFIGLFTSTVYNSHPQTIPLVRHKVKLVLENSKLSPNGHSAKELIDVLSTMPRDDLFQASTQELTDLVISILHIQQRPRIRLFARRDAFGRFISCLVYVPREKFTTELRQAIQEILLHAFKGLEVNYAPYFSESILARLHFLIRTDPKAELSYDLKTIESKIIEAARSWLDELNEQVVDFYGEEKGAYLINKYAKAFPASYQEDFTVRTAVFDIEHMENLTAEHPLEISFYRLLDEPANYLHLKLFQFNVPVALSDVLPMLENLGLRVIAERPHEIIFKNDAYVWINDFILIYNQEEELDVEQVRSIFEEAFTQIWLGEVENDGFNRLVLSAQLTWREVTVLRAYTKYLRQIGFTFSQNYIEATMAKYPDIAKKIIKLFNQRFDPGLQNDKTGSAIEEITQGLRAALNNVANLDDDRMLRRLLEVMRATIRTNYFQIDKTTGKPKAGLAFKLNPSQISDMPLPRPLYEIFVYSPRIEGIHLRMAKVARGGLRWSDRREDFRTEVLGLVKAQLVKNAVIVPSGAKGGFVVKNLPVDGTREAIMEEVISCYQTFIRALLDLTDNLHNGKVVPPANTVRYDEDDTYLVVAADKGTATFSDIANGIAKDYDFWLGDAFASGGSAGYDHKKMGITARGGWESVKRHLRALAIDPDKQDFTVIGIGDMAGDVFGNGMLLSRHIKLVGAFNHLHIFLDPNPNAEASFVERERLFNLPRSSWEDYNPELISKGGGVFKRSAKSIAISPEVKQLLGIEEDALEPNQLIKAMLKAEVDLIWNGGIGTYVKATSETNSNVGDRSNDPLRINGNDLRCKAVGEGGNLGFTQLGRIEYALKGGLIYTDFIDNSAGVDCSDHEVNIKILLNDVVTAGDMTVKQRNELLAAMTDEVARLVLDDNYNQTRAISLAASQAIYDFELYKRYLNALEKSGKIDRELEYLPDDKALLDRKQAGKGLTSSEIAILLAYTKIIIKASLLESDAPEDPYLATIIEAEFPRPLREKYRKQMDNHKLRREIVATHWSSRMVNDMGITFAHRMQTETGGSSIPAILRAYVIAREVFGISELIELIEALNYQVSSEICYTMMAQVARLARRAARWFLRSRRDHLSNITVAIERFKNGIKTLNVHLSDLLVGGVREHWDHTLHQFEAVGVQKETAARLASVGVQYSLLDVVEAATENNLPIEHFAAVYFALGEKLELAWLRERITTLSTATYWDFLARASLRDELDTQQRNITIAVLQNSKQQDVVAQMDTWINKHEIFLTRWQQLLNELRNAPALEFIMFSVVIRELVELVPMTKPVTKPAALKTKKN
jgi:glutamate dehydrogenase